MLDNQKFLDAATQPDGTSTEDAIEAKYGKCFDGSKKIGDMLAEELIIRDDRGNPTNDSDRSDEKNLCAPNNLDPTNNEFGQYMVFRWRVSHNHSNSLDDLINKQELTKETSSASAPDTSAPTSIDVAKVFDDSSKIKCAEGTDDVGVHTGYHNGKSVKIQLCTLPDMPSSSEDSTPGNSLYIAGANGKALVNSRVSASFLALYKAAKQDNIPMSAQSTFRSMAHQTQLCNDNSACANGDNTFVAKPGTSNHQMGIAIDFTMADPTKYPLDHKKCVNVNGRCEAPGDKVWEWLDKNATKFGLKPYNAEFWHWSPNGK